MKVAVLGGTGRTGRLLVEELRRRGHTVTALVRDPARSPQVDHLVVGDSRNERALAKLVAGADAVVSALGPSGKDTTLHRETAAALVRAMRVEGVRRFVGVSGAGIDVPGDRKSVRDKAISRIIQALGGAAVADKPAEYGVFADSDLRWTLVRPPRLADGAATGRLDHDAHRSARATKVRRADLAVFLADVLEQDLYVRQAPLVANAP